MGSTISIIFLFVCKYFIYSMCHNNKRCCCVSVSLPYITFNILYLRFSISQLQNICFCRVHKILQQTQRQQHLNTCFAQRNMHKLTVSVIYLIYFILSIFNYKNNKIVAIFQCAKCLLFR